MMVVTLHDRTPETVSVYFTKAQQPEIKQMLPQKATSVEEALAEFAKTQLPGATSYGRTIYADGHYIGDVWIYGIDTNNTPNAMLSYCIFEKEMWGRGAATQGVRLFLENARDRFGLQTVGAFTYAENAASIRVLEKNGFVLNETFNEDGILSYYYQMGWFGSGAAGLQEFP